MADLSPAQLDTLRSDLWFGSLPSDLASDLIAKGVLRTLAAGQHLFFRGDPPDGLYAVLGGTLRVSGLTEAGKEAVLSLVEAPTWLGEIALFDRLPRTHDVLAEDETTVMHVRLADIDQMLRMTPQHWQQFGILMALKTRLVFISLEDLSLLPPEGRLARRLVWMVQSAAATQREGKVRLNVSQGNLALMLSMSRQTANRALMALQAQGIIRVAYGVIEVLDREALADVAHLTFTERKVLAHLLGPAADGHGA